MKNIGLEQVKSRLSKVPGLHYGAVIRGRVYQNNRLVGIIIKEGTRCKAVYF